MFNTPLPNPQTIIGSIWTGSNWITAALVQESPKKRGATIYAEVLGGGMSADAHHLTAPHPEGLGAKNVMINALKDAGSPNNPYQLTYAGRNDRLNHNALRLYRER